MNVITSRARSPRRRAALVGTALVTVVTTLITTVPVTASTPPTDPPPTTVAPEPEPTTTPPPTEAPTTTAPPATEAPTTTAAPATEPPTTEPAATEPPSPSVAPDTTPPATEPVESSPAEPTDAPLLSGVPLSELALGAESVSGLPGVPQPPVQAFIEDFEAGQPSAPRSVADYRGAGGTTYTADAVWTTGGAGVIAAYGDATPPADWPGTPEEWAIARTLADAVGQWGGMSPSTANHVVAELPASDPGAGGVVLASSPISVTPGHYYTVALDVAAVNCVTPPAYDLALVVDGNEVPVSSGSYDVCAAPGVVAGDVVIGTGVGSAPVLVTGDSTEIVVRSAQGATSDSVIDNVRLVDVTPQLDVELTAADDAQVGDVVPLTFTVTNSAELAAKPGWSFTAALPEGLAVSDPADVVADGVEATAEPGSGTITVSGDLAADAASATVTVNVVASAAGTYTLDAGAFELAGLNPPGSADVTFADSVDGELPAAGDLDVGLLSVPGFPGAPQDPTLLWEENFDNVAPGTFVMLTDYVGADGTTYVAHPNWVSVPNANGIVLSENSPDPGTPGQDAQLKFLTSALGGFNGTPDPATNFAVSAYTAGDPGANLVQFATADPLDIEVAGRFIGFSVNAVAMNCTSTHPLLRFYLIDDGVEIPVSSTPIDPCTMGEPLPGGPNTGIGTFVSNDPLLFTGDSLGISMRNEQGSGAGNDGAFDDIRVLDLTPQLDKEFSVGSTFVGDVVTLTFTITNTTDLAAKPGWSFTDTLPDGLVVAGTPNATTDCTNGSVTATAGGDTIDVAGDLDADQASCTVSVDVTSSSVGTYENCDTNISDAIGVNPPGCTTVEFETLTQPPFECASNAAGILVQGGVATLYQIDLVTGTYPDPANIYPTSINGLGYNVLDDYLYGYDVANGEIVRIGSDGTVAPVGLPDGVTPSNFNIGDIDENGHYWLAVEAGPWVEIDLAPGSPTFMTVLSSGTFTNPAGLNSGVDWAHVPGGGDVLYRVLANQAAGDSHLVAFDPAANTMTDLGALGIGVHTVGAVYADASGYLYASSNGTGEIFRIDVATSEATLFANGPVSGANDGARCFLSPILIDFGDAPDSYGTTLGADGARHGIPGFDEATNTAPLMLGDENTIDPEDDGVPGVPGAAADGDDLDGVDDEGAVAEPVVMTAGQPLTLTVTATNDTDTDATLAGWIDLDGNGTFDAAELVTTSVPAGSGSADYTLDFPAGTVDVDTYLRLRLFPGAVADPLPTGPASAGEVEDYLVTVEQFTDFGDAPDTYGTLLAADGPAHAIPGYDPATNTATFMLGALIDGEDDGQPGEMADGDDTNGVDDEDGVVFNADLGYPNPTLRTGLDPVSLQPVENTLDVTASADGFVSVWVDWNLDGEFTADEQVAAAQAVTAGENQVTFEQGVNPDDIETYVRVRYSTDADAIAEPTGQAPDGEVEDYRVLVERLIQPDACVNTGAEYYAFTFNSIVDQTGTGSPGSTSRYPNVSVVNGVAIDMIIETIAGETSPNTAPPNGHALGDGTVIGVDDARWQINADATIRYSFYESGTTTPVAVNGVFTINDMDGPPQNTQEIATFDAADLAAYAVTQGSLVQIVEDGESVAFRGTEGHTGDPESRFQIVLDGIDTLETRWQGASTVTGSGGSGFGFDGDGDLSIDPPACDDYGDAPESYGTLLADDGPRHTVVDGVYLGELIDFDPDGQPSELADGDDTANLADEDGVVFNADLGYPNPTLRTGLDPVSLQPMENTLDVTASADGFVSVWVDWNLDGEFTADEQVAAAQAVTAGENQVTFEQGVNPDDIETYVRVRYSTDDASVAEPTGQAPDGEVEDYRVLVERYVRPDVCAATGTPYYAFTFNQPVDPTGTGGVGSTSRYQNVTVVNGVPVDLVVETVAGATNPNDAAPNGYGIGSPTGPIGSDDARWQIDEDATVHYSFYESGTTTPVTVNAVFTVNDMDGTPEVEIATFSLADLADYAVAEASDVTAAESGGDVQFIGSGDQTGGPESRFQIIIEGIEAFEARWQGWGVGGGGTSAGSGFGFDGDGDLSIEPACDDYGDAPESYGTLLADDGAHHTIVPGLFMGAEIDVDPDGQPTDAADGDDTTNLADEDGVAAPIEMAAGSGTTVSVTATNDTDEPATLVGWIDLDGNGTFDDDEYQTIAVPAGSGSADYTLDFPAGTTDADTYLRLRLFPGLVTDPLPTGPASAGEVEDHPVTLTSLHVEKSSDPEEGTPVSPGDVVTYTVRIVNDGNTPVTDTVIDDLTNVLDDADYNGDATVTIGDVTFAEPELTWTGTLQPGDEAVITYSVTVFGGNGSELTTLTALDTPNRQNADGWTVTSYTTDPGCAALNPPDSPVPSPAIWGNQHTWFGEGLSPRADQTIGGGGCYGTWPGYDAAPNSWVLSKTFESPADAIATVLATGFRADGGARVRINGVDAGLYGQWNQPAVDGTAQIPVTAGANTIEIEVRDINGPNLVQGRLDVQIVQLGDNLLENVVTGADCPAPPITDPEDPDYDPDCHNLVPVNRIDISKAVTSGPTPVGVGQYEVGYTITVTNSGAADGTYDLSDQLQYGDGVTVVSVGVVNTDPGDVAVNPAWNGQTDTTVATDVAIDGATGMTPVVHTYVVTAVVDVPPGTPAESTDCDLGAGEAGTGAFNTATMTTAGVPSDADACVELPTTEFTKELTSVTANGDGTFTLNYALTVSRTGSDGTYDLNDTLRYGDAVTVDSVTATNTDPGTVTTNPDFDGVGDILVAGGVVIGQAETHVYEIVVEATVDGEAVTFDNSDCELGAGETGTGFYNEATLDIDGTEHTDTACEPIPAITVDKEITDGPTPLGAGQYELVYTITATNAGAAGSYDLSDELSYGDGITVDSATVVNTDPGDIVVNPDWDGASDTVIVTDQAIAAGTADTPTAHTYTVTVVATVPPDLPAEAADCEVGPGETGSGFLNTATLNGDSGESTDDACVPVPVTSIDKTLVDVVENGEGTWTANYTIDVTQAGADGVYDLTDELQYGEAVTVEDVAAANTVPGDVIVNPAFDGIADTTVATDVAIAAGDTHTYDVAVTFSVDGDTVTFENSDCELGADESGTGLLNTATVTANGQSTSDDECAPPPATPTIDKEVTDGPTPVGDGTFETTYTITVTNTSAGSGAYDLNDELQYGDGITVDSATVVNETPGDIDVNPAWDGIGDTLVAADAPIDGAADAATPTVHTYTVTVVADVAIDITDEAADCELGAGESGTGFLNTATLTVNGETDDADSCVEVPRTDFDKELTGVVSNGDGTFTISYELTVTRDGGDGVYDLADTLAMSEAVTVESVTAENTAPGSVTVNPDFDGEADPVIATGVPIADGDTHTYTVDVVVTVDIDAVTFENSNCELIAGESGTGALNTASLTIDGTERTDDACVEFPSTTVDKEITDGPTAIGDGQYELTYTITAANQGAAPDTYTLTDELTYGDGVTVVSANVENTTPGDIVVDPAWNGLDATTVVADQAIDAATADGPAEHVYTVTVVFTVDPATTPEAGDCELGPDESGTGLLNTATVNGEAGEASDQECTEVPRTEFDKELASVVSNGDGTFDLTYVLTVSQSGADNTYDLTDSLMLNEAVTAESVTASNTTPGDITTNPGFDGQTDTTVASDVAIADGDTHVYEVVATVSVDLEAVTFENSNCELETGETGTGAMNQSTLTHNGESVEATDCEPFPATTVDKEILSGPTAVGGGEYELVYEIIVSNNGAGVDTYTLADELTYGDGITVVDAEAVNTTPGGIAVDPAWNGLDATTIVTDQPIDGATADGPAQHIYAVTVLAEAPADIAAEAADCDLGAGEAGTGFLNTVTLTGDAGESTDEDCVPAPSTTIVKTIDAVIGNGDGTYTISYLLTVERTGDGPFYSLDDRLQYGDAVTVESVSASNVTPGDIDTNPDFDGQAETQIVGAVEIADGDTHVYAVDVVVSVEGTEVTFANSDCTLTTDESGTGFFNTAELATNGSTITDDECVPPPAEPLVDKAITEGPTPIGDGQYELVYEITVTNPGAGIGTYSIDDELLYGDGIEVDSASVVNSTPGSIATNPAWDGIDETNIVTDAAIEAGTDAGPAEHVYTVTVVATAPADLTTDAADCELGDGETGTGFLNSATLTANGEPSEATDCEPAPVTTIDKELVTVTPNGDGTFTLDYDITVTRTGTGAPYTLTDELTYGDAVTVDSVVAANTTPGGIAVNPAFDGLADTTIAADVAIADGETHVYSVTVEATVDATEVTFENSDCELGTGESGTGFLNTATVSSNDSTVSDTDCAPPPAVTVDKAVTSGPAPLGDGTFEVVYTVTATNSGAGEGTYTLTDALRFGAGITIESATVANAEPGDIVVNAGWDGVGDTTIVTDQAIGAATADAPNAHTYTVTVVVGIPADLPAEAADCDLAQGEEGTGLLNETTINGDSGPSSDTDCVPPPVTDFDKELTDITSLGGAQFELTYELTATRVSGGPGTYTLNDSLMLGESLTIDEVTAANTAPGDIATNPAFDGVTDSVIAADVSIDDGEVHTYTVSVVVTVDIDAVTPGNSDCVLDPGESGTGAMNQASLDTDGVVDEADSCIEFPSTTVIKEVVDGPVALGDGTYGISYLITVLNAGAGDDEYTLDDTLTYGEGITVVTSEVANATPGDIVVNPDWNGLDATNIVTDQPIAGAETDPVVHTYEVDVVVEVDPATTLEAGDCTLAPGESGTGLLNQVAMTSATGDHEASACEEPPLTDPFKELVSTTPNGDGTTTLVYELTVTRQGDGPGYDLTDELQYGGAVTVESVSVANTQPGDIVTNTAFDGVTDTAIVTDQAIADGDVHLYEVTVVASIDEAAVTYENSACEAGSGAGGSGYLNTMAVSSNDIEVTDDACDPIAGITVDKELTTGPTDLGDNRYEVTYDIDVTNAGAGAGEYTLDDALQFADGVVVESADVANTAPGGIAVESGWNGIDDTRLVTDEPIAGATTAGPEVHTYTVTVVVDLSAGFTPEASDCVVEDPDAPATGLQNTATLTVEGEESTDDACTEIPGTPELDVTKVVSATTVQPNGNVGYTITVTNVGNVDYTDDNPAEVVDDLTDVLDDAVWLDNATATSGSLSFSAPNLTWTGALAVGETVTLTYSVRVNQVVTGPGELHNTVSAVLSNCAPGSDDPECETVTRIPPPPAPPAPVTPDPVPVTG